MEQRKKNPFIGTNMQDVFNKVKIGTYPLPNNLSWEVFSYYKAQWKLFQNINSIEAILNWSW